MEGQARIKVMGIGDAGNNIVNRMIEENVKYVSFIEINTDIKTLKNSKTKNTIQIGKQTTKGLGCGADATLGEKSAIENREDIKKILEDTDMLFLAAGMGGGTGTGAISVIAKIAREMKILTIGIVTKPFSFEGKMRAIRANQTIDELRKNVDALIIVLNDKLLETTEENITVKNAFKVTDKILKRGIQSITNLITNIGEINIDYADVRTIMGYKGGAYMGVGKARGEKAVKEAIKEAIDNRLTEIKIDGAKGAIINIEGNEKLGLTEVSDSIRIVNERIDPNANIIFGTLINNNLKDKVKVTIIATGIPENKEFETKKTNA